DVQLARALPKYPVISAHLAEVKLRPAQAEAIVLELEKTPSTVPVADLEVAERELARLTHLPPTELRKAAIQARDILDTDGPEPEEHKASARETLSLSSVDRGVRFKGYLANENAELFRSLITTGARPHKTVDGAPDPRSREKRQADALTTALTLAATALDTGIPSPTIPRPTTPDTSGTTGTTGTTTSGTAAAGDAAGDAASGTEVAAAATSGAAEATAAPGTPGTAGTAGTAGPDGPPAADPAPGGGCTSGKPDDTPATGSAAQPARTCGEFVPGFGAKANITVTIDLNDLKTATADAIGHTVYTNGLSAAAIRRLACDANIIPIVLGSASEPLDVGRCERLVTKGIRRALNTRDRGCVVCGAPPVMCDAHHLISWIDGGPTALWNLALLCRRHHTDLHNGHWHITITNGVVHVARPDWADPPPRPGPPPDTKSPPPSPSPDHWQAGPSPTADADGDGDRGGAAALQRHIAPSRSVTDPRTDPDDQEARRAATYLAIWGEPLPPPRPDEPRRGFSEKPATDPWAGPADVSATTAQAASP
ncbi:MAG TPA: DUF222 domain-containing protein, partial [Kribbella sp.]|nr:DUF222 domain-containing protein [Kribbella sp.]